jgi:hypothetical protein
MSQAGLHGWGQCGLQIGLQASVTGRQPVEPDEGPAIPVPTPQDEPGSGHLPHQKHHDPDEPDFDEAD